MFLLVNSYKYHLTVETPLPISHVGSYNKTYINRLSMTSIADCMFLFFIFFAHLIWAVMYNITQQQRFFKCYFRAPLPPKSVIRVKGGQHKLLICVTSDWEGKRRIRHTLIKGPARYFENWGERSPVTVQIPYWSLQIRTPSEALLIKSVYYTLERAASVGL